MESTAFNQAGWNPLHLTGMHFTMLHGMYCIQSRCMEYTAFNHAAWNSLHSIGIHCAKMHGIHCVQSKSIAPHCMESTAFNRDPFITLHGIHWVQSGCILPCCIESTAFSDAAWNHCIQSGCFGPRCIKSTAFNRVPFLHTAGNTMHSIGMHFNTLHGLHCCIMDYTAANMLHIIHCIQSGCILPGCMESMHSSHCMDSTAYNRDPLRHNAWNLLHSLTLHGIHCIQLGCFGPCCI